MRSDNALGNMAFRLHDRPLRHQDAPHEGYQICSHPTPPPSPIFCLMSVHEFFTTQCFTLISYHDLSTSLHTQMCREGTCSLL